MKLITANTLDRVSTVTAMTGHTWRERRCCTATSGVRRRFSIATKASSAKTVPARKSSVSGANQPWPDPVETK